VFCCLYSDVKFRRLLPAACRHAIPSISHSTGHSCLRSVEQVRPQRSAATPQSPQSKVADRLHSSGSLRSKYWLFLADVSGRPVGSHFQGSRIVTGSSKRWQKSTTI